MTHTDPALKQPAMSFTDAKAVEKEDSQSLHNISLFFHMTVPTPIYLALSSRQASISEGSIAILNMLGGFAADSGFLIPLHVDPAFYGVQ